jgi:hypothetical protein
MERVYSGMRAENLDIALDRQTGLYDKSRIPGCNEPDNIYVVTERFASDEKGLRGQILQQMLDDCTDMGREMVVVSGLVQERQLVKDPENGVGYKIGPHLTVDRILDIGWNDITTRFLDSTAR